MPYNVIYYPLTNICSIYDFLAEKLPKLTIHQQQHNIPQSATNLKDTLITEGKKLNIKTPIIIDGVSLEMCNGVKLIIRDQTANDISSLFNGFNGVYKYGVYFCDKDDSYDFEEKINVFIQKPDKIKKLRKSVFLIDILYDLRYSKVTPISQLPSKIRKQLSIITMCCNKLIHVLNKWFITPIKLPKI